MCMLPLIYACSLPVYSLYRCTIQCNRYGVYINTSMVKPNQYPVKAINLLLPGGGTNPNTACIYDNSEPESMQSIIYV